MKIRRVTSLTLMFAFLGMAVTGVILFLVPQGRVAYWADWRLLGLSKTQWGDVHIAMGLLMLLSGVLHVIYNWGPITTYLKNRSRELRVFTPEFNVALIIAVLFVSLTLLQAPPLSWLADLGESVKAEAATTYGEPPYGHAEESTLASFLTTMRWDEQESLDRLVEAGIEFEGRGQTLVAVAAANGVTPQDVYEAMKPTATAAGLPATPPAGLGRMSLAALGEEFGVDLNAMLTILGENRIEATGTDTLKELADDLGRNPRDLYLLLSDGLADGE